MKRIALVAVFVIAMPVAGRADLGSMLKAAQSNPLVAKQASANEMIGAINNISSVFSKMPATSGKLDFLKAALPILTKASTVAQKNPGDVNQIGGLLNQVKGLLAQKWPGQPLTTAQIPQATAQTQQFTGLLANLLKSQGAALKGLVQTPAGN